MRLLTADELLLLVQLYVVIGAFISIVCSFVEGENGGDDEIKCSIVIIKWWPFWAAGAFGKVVADLYKSIKKR